MREPWEDVKKILTDRKEYLGKLLRKIKKKIELLPEGTLCIVHDDKRTRYFCRTEKSQKRGYYIKACDRNLRNDLAQKRYCEK